MLFVKALVLQSCGQNYLTHTMDALRLQFKG